MTKFRGTSKAKRRWVGAFSVEKRSSAVLMMTKSGGGTRSTVEVWEEVFPGGVFLFDECNRNRTLRGRLWLSSLLGRLSGELGSGCRVGLRRRLRWIVAGVFWRWFAWV